MKIKNILAIALIVLGAIMLLFSDYIAREVTEGKNKVTRAQSQVDTMDSVFSASKYTKPIGKTFTHGAQKKIDAGQAEIEKYKTVSSSLRIGGIILILISLGLFFIRKKR